MRYDIRLLPCDIFANGKYDIMGLAQVKEIEPAPCTRAKSPIQPLRDLAKPQRRFYVYLTTEE